MIKIKKADTFYKRLVGLLKHDSLEKDEALLISPCRQVHTIGMKFTITAVYLDKNYHYLGKERLEKNQVGKRITGCEHVLELSECHYESVDEDMIRRNYEQLI